jgi:membrane fusion protein (multidrug efflux system)
MMNLKTTCMLKPVRSLFFSLPLAALTGLLVTGCSKGGGGEAPPPQPPTAVVFGKPVLEPVEDTIAALGSIEANERVEIKPEVSGLVQSILFKEGDHVKKGAKLFELDSRKEVAQVAQVKAEEELARQNAERAKQLAGTRAISQQEVDQLASQVDVRRATRQLEEERLADRVIYAPFDSVAGPRMVSLGQFVNVGTTLVTLVDLDKVKVSFKLPERHLAYVKLGQEARLGVGAFPGKVFTGKVDLINPEIDPTTRTVEIRLIAENPEGLLKPGMFARVELVTGRRENGLVIPEGALVAGLESFSVYRMTTNIVTTNNTVTTNITAHVQPVKLGVRMPGKVEIASGLTISQDIVVSGTQKLVDGAKVVHSPDEPTAATNATAAPTNAPAK